MKVCITAQGSGLDAAVDERFGRAPSFVLVETDTLQAEPLENSANQENHGAGVAAAMTVGRSGASALITGHCGPKAFEVLRAAGVNVYTGAFGSVRDAVQAFLDGKLDKADDPDVPAGGAR